MEQSGMKQSQDCGIASLHSVALAMTGFGSFISWNTLKAIAMQNQEAIAQFLPFVTDCNKIIR
jgi:hypothetical protein